MQPFLLKSIVFKKKFANESEFFLQFLSSFFQKDKVMNAVLNDFYQKNNLNVY